METPSHPPAIVAGACRAYFIYDVADTIDLARLGSVGAGTERAPLQLRREASPGFIEFPTPPVVAQLPDAPGGIAMRAKFFDYGVVAIRLTAPFSGSWSEFAACTRAFRADEDLPRIARRALDTIVETIAAALDEPHPVLAEEYYAFEVGAFATPIRAESLLQDHAASLASLVACEEQPLTRSERAETLRINFSYFEDDLVVVQWDTAFIYDRGDASGIAAVEDILEFANTQLVELRQHDALLDVELDTIYKLDPASHAKRRFGRREAQQAADRIRFLLVDVLELTDRTGNALKVIGDAYYARLYRGAAQRLGLRDWQKQIDSKLQSVNEMYRLFSDQAQTARSEGLEMVIILLIALEVVIGLLALHR